MRHQNLSKQTLTASDLPPDIPAATFASDLAYIVENYRPGNHNIHDIPEEIPVFNKTTGKFKRFIQKRTSSLHRKRVTSMPIIQQSYQAQPNQQPDLPRSSVESTKKELPSLPLLPPKTPSIMISTEKKRSISLYEPPQLYTNATTSSSSIYNSSGEDTQSIEFKTPSKPKHVVIDEDDDESSVFSYPASSIYSSHSSAASSGSNSESIIAKSILDVVHGYTTPASSDKSSILSSPLDYDNMMVTPIQDSEIHSKYEIESFVDSLFSDWTLESKKSELETPPTPPPHSVQPCMPLTPPTPISEAMVAKPQKQLPSIPKFESQSQPTGTNPSTKLSSPPLQISKARKSQMPTITPHHSNQSSISTMKSDPKAEIKAYMRQRPFSYSLDGPKQYKLSRFPSLAGQKKHHRLPSTPVALPKYGGDFYPRRVVSDQIATKANISTASKKGQPRNISEYNNINNINKHEVIKNHIQDFLVKEKKRDLSKGKNLPQAPGERQNRFGVRESYYG
ncbi:uncharacterized protein RJT21DRAFT_118749 [Scheffersomyces amazonensis]|uniref:uncharacterized protein n=1 Tax=Scheffersomyces amazonensis TaxID=1078765 RepID=UPI00315D8402